MESNHHRRICSPPHCHYVIYLFTAPSSSLVQDSALSRRRHGFKSRRSHNPAAGNIFLVISAGWGGELSLKERPCGVKRMVKVDFFIPLLKNTRDGQNYVVGYTNK